MNSISITINTVGDNTYVNLARNFKKIRSLIVAGEPMDAEAVVELVKRVLQEGLE